MQKNVSTIKAAMLRFRFSLRFNTGLGAAIAPIRLRCSLYYNFASKLLLNSLNGCQNLNTGLMVNLWMNVCGQYKALDHHPHSSSILELIGQNQAPTNWATKLSSPKVSMTIIVDLVKGIPYILELLPSSIKHAYTQHVLVDITCNDCTCSIKNKLHSYSESVPFRIANLNKIL